MLWFSPLYILINLVSAFICVSLAIVCPKDGTQTDKSFQAFALMCGLWCLLSSLFFLNDTPQEFWVWTGFQVVPYAFTPVLWVVFVSKVTNVHIGKIRRLFIIPSLTIGVYWFPYTSHLMWTLHDFETRFGYSMVFFQQGGWFKYIHVPYSYGLMLLGLGILLLGHIKSHKISSKIYLILFISGILPILINLLHLSPIGTQIQNLILGKEPTGSTIFDITQIGLTISIIFFCWGFYRYQLLQRSPIAYEAIYANLKHAILVFNTDQNLVEANQSAHQLLTLSESSIGCSLPNIIDFLDERAMTELLQQGFTEATYGLQHLQVERSAIKRQSLEIGTLISIQDVTEARQLEQQILQGALLYDALTRLPNRTLFLDRLEQANKRFCRHPLNSFAVLFLDLDRFKVINDSLGHSAGDQLLIEVARRLITCLRTQDTIARLGGDEFAILAEDVSEAEVKTLCDRIQTCIHQPIVYGTHQLMISVSIGIAFGSENCSPEQLIRNADLAMYQTKSKGKDGYTVYEKHLHGQIIQTMQREVDLRYALDNDQFFLEFQPIVHLSTDRISGFEALMRWQHPNEGIIPPVEFISVAEEMGLISLLDRWVLNRACQQLRTWNRLFPGHGLTVSINLSSAILMEADLVTVVMDVLDRYNLQGNQLKLEITESILMDNPHVTVQVLMELKELGVLSQLDDFGTGYSSLSYLHNLPLDALKIDRSFVQQAVNSHQSSAIIKSIVDLALNLKLEVIGEGVETLEQQKLLQTLGCALGQGFFWGKPQSAQDATRLVSEHFNHQKAFFAST